MSNIALQIERLTSGSVAAGANVVFEQVVYTDGNISYDNTSGTITFNETGRYVVEWWVATQSSPSSVGVVFAISSSQGDFLEGNSPIKTGVVVGFGIINVAAAPMTASLVNASMAPFTYSSAVPIKATLVVVEDDIVGLTGPTGPTGATGPIGPTGDTGPAAPAVAGYVYHLAAPTAIVSGDDVPFSNNGPLEGVTHTPGSTDVTVPETGIYQVDYAVYLDTADVVTIAIAVNGTVDASTNVAADAQADTFLSGSALLQLNAGDFISLRNTGAGTITLNGTPEIRAQLVVTEVVST